MDIYEQLKREIRANFTERKPVASAMDEQPGSVSTCAATADLRAIAEDAEFEDGKVRRVAKGGKGGGQFTKKPETLAKEDSADILDPNSGSGGDVGGSDDDGKKIVSDMKSWCEKHGLSYSDEFIAEQAKKVQEKVKKESGCSDSAADIAIHNIRLAKSKSVSIGSSSTPEGQAERAWLKKNCKGELRALNKALMDIHFLKSMMSDGYEDVPSQAMQDKRKQKMYKYRMRANAVKNMIRRKGYPEAAHKSMS